MTGLVLRTAAGAALATLLIGAAPPPAIPPLSRAADAFLATSIVTATDPAAIAARCDQAMALATRIRVALEARTGTADIATDFALYDSLESVLNGTVNDSYILASTAIAKPVRDAGQACEDRLATPLADIALSRPIYDRLSAIPAAAVAPSERYMLDRTLLSFRLAGVDRAPAVRARIAALTSAIATTGNAFDRAINDDHRTVTLPSTAALAGLPADFLAAHRPNRDGTVTVSTSYPDYIPTMRYADRATTRQTLADAFFNRAWPANDPVLSRLIAERAALAGLIGMPDFATLNIADKMAGDPARVQRFIDDIYAAAKPAGEREMAVLLARAKRIDPAISSIRLTDSPYLNRLVKAEHYDADPAEIRRYFTLDKTRMGIFRLVHDLFGSDVRPWNAPVWAPGVTAWSLYDGDTLVGHFYLDLSPRDGKYTHAEMVAIRAGLRDRSVPVAALLTNFPATGPMEHGDVITFLHEYGHLLHDLYASRHRFDLQGFDVENDFVEAPSQMLENWAWDYDTLRTFASDDAGRPIPAMLVKRMNDGRRFGSGINWSRQLGLSAVSLGFYGLAPGFPLDATYRSLNGRYAPFPDPAGTHGYASFDHLNGYAASYYTYAWSEAIAFDLLSRFRAAGMRDRATAAAYRRDVLEATGTRPAAALIRDFLGRDWTTAAFKREIATP